MTTEITDATFLTAGLPGIGGFLREKPEDFRVDELLARKPSGQGDYAWALIQKYGISTPELQRRLGSALAIHSEQIGVAGMKDKDAFTRQWISAPWADEPKLAAAKIKDVEILQVERDDSPLWPGAHGGNRFDIHVRGVGDEKAELAKAQAIVSELTRRGVPNFFGAQRFGIRREMAEMGRRLLLGDAEGALALLLGAPSALEGDLRARQFRKAYEEGRFSEALASVPGRLSGERRLLELLAARRPKRWVANHIALPTRRFALSAWQSLQFNRVVARRLQQIDIAQVGDWLLPEPTTTDATHDSGAKPRQCSDAALDQPAVTALALHPTAPLFGDTVELAAGEPGTIEQAVFAESKIAREKLRRPVGLALYGERRPARFIARDFTVTAPDTGTLRFQFTLPPGSFATTLLAEVMKDAQPVV